MALKLLDAADANAAGPWVSPDPIRANTWEKAEQYLVYVTDASTFTAGTLTLNFRDPALNVYTPGGDAVITPSGDQAIIIELPQRHEVRATVASRGASDEVTLLIEPYRRS